MKATNFLLDPPGLDHAWAERRRSTTDKKSPGLLERIDRWLWRQQVRDREAYLAKAQDIFELEDRMRRIERMVGSRYY